MMSWQDNLETVGADLFLRYRKRLMAPWIALEIRSDYPGLSIVDVLVRVHAGRRIIQDGDDFRALQAIRSGRWQRTLEATSVRSRSSGDGRRDRVSRCLVRLGGALFIGFCMLSFATPLAYGGSGLLMLGLGVALAAAVVVWRRRAGIGLGRRTSLPNRGVAASGRDRIDLEGRRDMAPSL